MNNGRLQFFNLVKAMREAQREYFSTRSHEALQKARSLERSVDAYIKRGDDYLKAQRRVLPLRFMRLTALQQYKSRSLWLSTALQTFVCVCCAYPN